LIKTTGEIEMNVREIIDNLKGYGLTEEMPADSVPKRKENKYGAKIYDTHPNYSPQYYEHTNRYNEYTNDQDPSDFIWIPDGNAELTSVLPSTVVSEIENEIKKEGIEVLAWYRSFHWNPTDKWGIYILDSGIYYIAQTVFNGVPQISRYGRPYNTLDLLCQSFRLLFLHEFFHYITDISATLIELGDKSPQKRYVPYFKNIYQNIYLHPTTHDEPIEEALANAYAYNRFQGRDIRNRIRNFMRGQPSGYSAFEEYIGKNFRYGTRRLGSCIGQETAFPRDVAPLEALFDCNKQYLSFGDVPIYIVHTIDNPKYQIRFVKSIPQSAIIESPRFKKDFEKLPANVQKQYQDTLKKLEMNARHRGLKFEHIKGCDAVFALRVGREYRLSLRQRQIDGKWEFLRIGKHDDILHNPGGC